MTINRLNSSTYHSNATSSSLSSWIPRYKWPPSPLLATGVPTSQTKVVSLSAAEIQGILSVHNQYRANHQAEPLSWSTALAQAALSWCEGSPEQKALSNLIALFI